MSATVASRGNAKVTQKELNEKFQGLQAVLKDIKNTKGIDLYSHIQEVFKQLILHYPDQALEKLEEVSYLLKHKDTIKMEDFLKVSDMRNYKDVCGQMNAYINKLKPQFGAVKSADDEEDAEPAEAAPVGYVPDLIEEAAIFQWAGIGFGQQELYRLQKSLKKLSGDTGAGKLRFFGKIRGSQNDYYVAEGEVDAGEGDDEENAERGPDFEPKGTGINKLTYWVSHSSFAEWKKLPDITP